MARLPIRWIEVRTYCHATEEEDRVARALETACPVGETKREALEGHFGNPLVRLTRRVEGARGVGEVWHRWTTSRLPHAIATDIDARVDEDGVLHFRLAKQRACEGDLVMAYDPDTLDVRLKLMAFPAKSDEARRVARGLLAEVG